MTRPTQAALAFARSTLPVRRVASPGPIAPGFAALLKSASLKRTPLPQTSVQNAGLIYHAAEIVPSGPAPISRTEILANADKLMGIPYVWGGARSSGLDCSAFVSKVWSVSRHTTDTLASISHPISKNELQAGDALNLTTGRDPEGDGHVRLFEKWADASHSKIWVYEETPPKSVHHVINWDPSYQPMRRNNVVDA